MRQNNIIRIHVLHCGSISVSPQVPFGGRGRLLNTASGVLTGAAARIELPVSAYLIEHPRGLVLVDTGWCREISPDGVYDSRAVGKLLPPQLAAFYRPRLPLGQAVDEQLAALGIKPEDISCVLLTHFDPDHICGLRHLTGAGRILAAEEERWWAVRTVNRLRQPQQLWADYPIEVFWYKGTPIGPNRWSYDLFGDGSIVLVNLPGHTDGMFAVLIYNNGKYLLLSSDAAFSRRSWQELLIPGFGFNPVWQKKSLEWVREMSLSPDCLGSIANHDPDEASRIIEL